MHHGEAARMRERVHDLYDETDRMKRQMRKPWQYGTSEAELKQRYRTVIDEITELNVKLRRLAEQWEKERVERQRHQHQQRQARANADPSSWWNVLKIERSASIAEINAAWRSRARECHPDVGGSLQEMQMVNLARGQALNAKKGPASRS